jgi:hypothetical protein
MRARGVVSILAILQLVAAAGPALAGRRARTFASAALPSRAPQARALLPRAERVALGLMRSLAGAAAPASERPELAADTAAVLARGRELYRSGSLDQAARVLDEGLETAAREPHRFGASEVIVTAQVARVTIALARGENERADLLLERLLRWDPTFSPADGEGSPRLAEAIGAVRKRLPTPALRPEDLAGACALADVLVVARPARGGRIELFRFDQCQLVARVEVEPLAVERAVEALGGRADALSAPIAPAERPLVRRPWFWAAIGAAAVATTLIAIWQLPDRSDEADVVPHL